MCSSSCVLDGHLAFHKLYMRPVVEVRRDGVVPVPGGGQKDLGEGAKEVQPCGAHHPLIIARKNRVCIVKPCFLLLK